MYIVGFEWNRAPDNSSVARCRIPCRPILSGFSNGEQQTAGLQCKPPLPTPLFATECHLRPCSVCRDVYLYLSLYLSLFLSLSVCLSVCLSLMICICHTLLHYCSVCMLQSFRILSGFKSYFVLPQLFVFLFDVVCSSSWALTDL